MVNHSTGESSPWTCRFTLSAMRGGSACAQAYALPLESDSLRL
jgi:hypothetical protein